MFEPENPEYFARKVDGTSNLGTPQPPVRLCKDAKHPSSIQA